MAREKIPDPQKKLIANLHLRGKKFDILAELIGTCPATARKADKIGGLLNTIDELEQSNREKDVALTITQNQLMTKQYKSIRK